MVDYVIVDSKKLLSMFARDFNFSLASRKEKRRAQGTMYILNSAGIKTGYNFSWWFQYLYSEEIIKDIHEIFSNPREYEKTKEYSFNDIAKQKLIEIKTQFLESAKNPRQLELLTCSHYIFNNHYRKTSGLFHQFKKNFKKHNPKMQVQGSKIKTDELKQAWVQTANLIAYRNYYDNINSQK